MKVSITWPVLSRKGAILDAPHLLIEQLAGLSIHLVEHTRVKLRRYSRVCMARKLRQHVDEVQLGAGSFRYLPRRSRREGGIFGPVGGQEDPPQERIHLSKRLSRSPTCPVTVASLRTTNTGQWAWRATEPEILPISARLIPPSPRLPITIKPAPISSAKATISSSALPILRWAWTTLPPVALIFLT